MMERFWTTPTEIGTHLTSKTVAAELIHQNTILDEVQSVV